MFRRSLVIALTVIFIFPSAVCLGYTLPGTLFDQDKSHLLSEPINGASWTHNWYNDINGNLFYDPGEPWSDIEFSGRIYVSDDSCWMAVASNIVKYLGGGDWYDDWAYNGTYSDWLGQKTFENGGDAKDLLESLGYTTRSIGGLWNPYTGWNGDNPADWMLSEIQQGSPLRAAIGIDDFAFDKHHAVTVYGIDTIEKTILLADSDNDYFDDFRICDYAWDGDNFLINLRGHDSHDTTDWEYVYNVMSVDMTGLNFLVTPTHGPNGSIYPDTSFTAEYHENVTFYATYDTGYEVDKWYVNGEVAFTGGDNIVLVITEPTTVLVTFKPDGMTPSQILVAGSTNPDIFEFSMQPDDSQSLLIPVYNPGTSSTVVNVSKSGTASSWTSLESTSFTLASHELKKFQITVDSPDGVASGTYTLNISFNGIVQPISIRVADLGDDYHVNLSPSTASINGNNTCGVRFQFNNLFYDYFDISGKYQTFAQTYCDLSENQYINAEDYYLVLWVENLGATSQNLIVKMNNQPIGAITTDQVAIGEIDQYRISGGWETLTSGQNVLTFGLSQWDQSSTTPLWRIYDGIAENYALGDLLYLETCLTTSAYVSSPINLPSNVLQLINDGYMALARVYGTVTSCSSDGKVYLYNNGQNVDSENIYTSEVGDREYWSLGKSELASSNLFALKGDSSTEPVVGLSNLKLEITFNTNDPVLDVKKQLSSNRIQLGQQTTVTVHVENTAEGSSTGYDTDLKDSLPPGLTLSGGVLNKSNIGKLNFEDTYTNTYTITANQVGHYTLPSARVDYETYDGDPVIDESVPVDLNVVYGQLTVNEPNVIYSRLVNESGIHLSAVVLDVDGITPITDADVYAIVEKDFGDVLLWQVIYIVPMGWSQTDQSYIGITPAVQYGGNYRATIVAQKDWYEDGQSEQAVFYVHEPKPDITGEGVINLLDYSLLAARWLNDCNNQNNWCDGADIDHSGFVGFEDLLIMAEQWLSDSLVGYWSFDDSGAITAIDYSGNNNDGKIYGALPISGISGQALSFDGVDDYIEFPPLTNGSKTFSFCFKTTATGVERFLSYDGGYYQDLWSIQLDSNGKVLFGAREIESGDCPQLIGSNVVNDGQWHHLVLVLNTETNESTLYIDGEVQAYSSQLTSDLTMFDHVFYGMWDNFNYNGAYTNGIIDEIRIYNRVLSAAEIQSLYQNP